MSYIDTFDHELVGFFAGLPLYHPLEMVAGAGGDEFSCTPEHLILGGGSSEHPAIVVTQPRGAVMAFLQSGLPAGIPIPAAELDVLDAAPAVSECLHYAGWMVDDYVAFAERCSAPSFVTPYDSARDHAVEEWVLRNLGEFVYLAMPEPAPNVQILLPTICAQVREPRYYNVHILPPGYGAPAGRFHDANGDVIYGNYLWTTQRHASS